MFEWSYGETRIYDQVVASNRTISYLLPLGPRILSAISFSGERSTSLFSTCQRIVSRSKSEDYYRRKKYICDRDESVGELAECHSLSQTGFPHCTRLAKSDMKMIPCTKRHPETLYSTSRPGLQIISVGAAQPSMQFTQQRYKTMAELALTSLD